MADKNGKIRRIMKEIEKHKYFELWYHTNSEIEKIFKKNIIQRTNIHEWPLSCVQKIKFSDNTSIIYKVQNKASVEVQFYKNAISDLLPNYTYLGKINNCDILTFEYIEGTRVSDITLSENEILSLGEKLIENISNIKGDLPVFTDIRNVSKWHKFINDTLSMLSNLIKEGVFTKVPISQLNDLKKWSEHNNVITTLEVESGFTHGDLNGDNIFLTNNGLKVIDWQRPKFAPRNIDLIGLLIGHNIDPLKYCRIESVQLFWFLELNWFTLCKSRYFKQGKSYERAIIDLINLILK